VEGEREEVQEAKSDWEH